jgi:hypothetical protein
LTGDGVSVVVLGMHRSGTSLATALLAAAGLRHAEPESQFETGQFNKRGSQEIAELTQFNDRILRELGGRWSAPPESPPDWNKLLGSRRLRSRAAETFERHLGGSHWVWKDPRLCLTLPFWEDVLGEQATIVMVRRNPLETVESLQRRNGFSAPLSLALWEVYLRSALTCSAGHRVAVVDYEQLLSEPADWVEQIRGELLRSGEKLGPAQTRAEIEGFSSREFRHSEHDRAALARNDVVSPQQLALFDLVASLDAPMRDLGAVDLPDLTPWAGALLEERRRHPPRRPRNWRRSVSRQLTHARRFANRVRMRSQ